MVGGQDSALPLTDILLTSPGGFSEATMATGIPASTVLSPLILAGEPVFSSAPQIPIQSDCVSTYRYREISFDEYTLPCGHVNPYFPVYRGIPPVRHVARWVKR
jgi:hypothetical protein